ncbi:flagellar basal body-associated FliL family protein [Limisalsivibrio acetivorans]|uniref:flagellar basal body-associated FliL family protein n=1 Tax=Limisalsivibrio acetivorans TaxID=1304888 RepID=UPI0003B44581|nr:flagellar basal body-associated FliL family protein [Limisalsivibrio acetivorans]
MKIKIGTVVILIVIALAIFFVVNYKDNLGMSISAFTGPNENPFDEYKAEKEEAGESYHVRFKDIVTSVSDPTGRRYIRMDLSIETKNEDLADKMTENQDHTAKVITNALSTAQNINVRDDDGKMQVKNSIRQSLGEYYNTDKIDNVYFENFVYD